MKKLERILRFLFIRLVFMVYCLLCVWKVLLITKDNQYWFLLVFILGIVIESGLMLWLRQAYEFKQFMPSTLFFLFCVIPSIWITCLNDVQLKKHYHQKANMNEMKIKSFLHTLDATSRSKRQFESALTEPTAASYPLDYLWEKIIPKNLHNFPEQSDGVDCCVFKISYWFQEDVWIRIYFQIFLAILIMSHLLIAEHMLKIPQRIIKLVISFLIAYDILNFFNLVLVETVFKSQLLLFTVLSVTSISLLQFSFLLIGETLYPVFRFNVKSSQVSQVSLETSEQTSGQTYFDESAFMYDNNLLKGHNRQNVSTQSNSSSPINSITIGSGHLSKLRNQSSLLLSNLNLTQPQSCICQKNNFVLTLFIGLMLHDFSYGLTRAIVAFKLGLRETLSIEPTLYFFIFKNVIVTVTQLYRLGKHVKRAQRIKIYDQLKSLLSTTPIPPQIKLKVASTLGITEVNSIGLPKTRAHLIDFNKNSVASPPPDYCERKELAGLNSFDQQRIANNRIYEKKSDKVGKNFTNYAYMEKKPLKFDQNWKLSNSVVSTESLDLGQSTSFEADKSAESDDQQKVKDFHLRQYEVSTVSDGQTTPINDRKVTPFNPFSANRVESPLYALPISKQKSNYYAKRAVGLNSKNRHASLTTIAQSSKREERKY